MLLFWVVGSVFALGQAKPNVLMIAIDDLRPALGCFGDKTAITPNIDRLAKRGMVFNQAHCQQAVCCPSRLSMLTGLRPDTIQVWDLGTHFRQAKPDTVTLPQHFKNNGYHTRSIGKILHGGGKPSKDPESWSEASLHDNVRDPKVRYALPKNLKGSGLKRAASESADVADDHYIDGIVTNDTLRVLGEFSRDEQPFFLAVGFRKPHLPFSAPKKYWDLYDREKIPLPAHAAHPADAPEWATRSWRELEGYSDIPKDGKITEAKVRELRHGYYACVSYVDALIGKLLNEIDRLKLRQNTLILVYGDHGFHLGEQGLWTKANNFELSTRVPLIVSAPGQPHEKTDALVELVDVF
ncbi:MAG TPA: iduronate-2-sulfatase, partial [Verrucomicrobiales bacterium]|nr:iduronate-2-sulfatase [Verrucomicrobiales bacterium]